MTTENVTAPGTRYLRVRIVDHGHPDQPTVNVRIPLRIVKFGMQAARAFSPDMRKADLDWGAITALIDEGMTGELVHVENEADHKTIDVSLD